MKSNRPFRQLREWRRVTKTRPKYARIDRAAETFEDPANAYHCNHATLADETVFEYPHLRSQPRRRV